MSAPTDPPVAIVTAAGAGIGAATAKALAEAGCRLGLADVDDAGLAETAAALPAGADPVLVVADVTTETGAAEVVERTVSAYQRLSCLVNVVGGSRPGRTTLELGLAEWDELLALNLTSVFLMCRAALPHLIDSRGTIVNVASGAGLRGMRANPGYVAAKAGVVGLTRALALDHGPAGVRVNCVAPGPIRTPLMRRNRTEAQIAELGKVSVTGRIGEPEEIAAAIRWLAGPESSYVVGQTVEVDGGVASLV